MSEESNVVISPIENDGSLKIENETMAEHIPSPSAESIDKHFEYKDVQENRQPIEPAQNKELNRPLDLRTQRNMEAADSNSSEQQLTTSDVLAVTQSAEGANDIDQPAMKSTVSTAADSSPSEQQLTTSASLTETKSLEGADDIDHPAMKSTASTEMSPIPASEKALKGVTDNIQIINEGLKDMKLSELLVVGSASGKKGRKPAVTPRARSTPVKFLTSPPLTRSRSRDLIKFPSTPESPGRLVTRKGSESDSEGARGRQRVKKN